MSQFTYKQEIKNRVRHTVIKKAVELLTTQRMDACCVRNSYVRDIYDYFLALAESHEQIEAAKIDPEYIRQWEFMHANLIGHKRADELSVCYLSGPEPENDFIELVNMGVLPQNIWAFENEKSTYLQALASVDGSNFMQPKIMRTTIEKFFENSPKKFDIVYIDACSTLISDRHSLRCVASLFQNHRLNSPGILITNFAFWDSSKTNTTEQYVDLISRYYIVQRQKNAKLAEANGTTLLQYDDNSIRKEVEENLEDFYGDFITAMVCNTASITIPTLRFCNSAYINALSPTGPATCTQFNCSDVNAINDNTLFKYLAMNQCLMKQGSSVFPGTDKVAKLTSELSGFPRSYDLLSCMQKTHEIKTKASEINPDLQQVIDFFDNSSKLYQFLDKPNRILFFDSVINQLSYPMHFIADKATRLSYVAKETRMFTDLLLFDECRYIYDWIPAIHQIPKSFSNPSWQYTFRFGLDGLVKQRIAYNNEFFYQGSVINKKMPGFETKLFSRRDRIN